MMMLNKVINVITSTVTSITFHTMYNNNNNNNEKTCTNTSINNINNELVIQQYKSIVQKAIATEQHWPDCTNFVATLDTTCTTTSTGTSINNEQSIVEEQQQHQPQHELIYSCRNNNIHNNVKYFLPTKFDNEQGPYGIVALFQLPKNNDEPIDKERLVDSTTNIGTDNINNTYYYGLGQRGYNSNSVPLIQNGLFPIFTEFYNKFLQVCYDNNNNDDDTSDKTITNIVNPFYHYEAIYSNPVPHLTIAIFHEHPKLLSKLSNELKYWLPTSTETMYGLVNYLNEHVFSIMIESSLRNKITITTTGILLQLHSILLTPDGAMIAGFIDITTPTPTTPTTTSSSSSLLTDATRQENNKQQTTTTYYELKQSLIDSATVFLKEQHQLQQQQQQEQQQHDQQQLRQKHNDSSKSNKEEEQQNDRRNNTNEYRLTSLPKRLIHITLGRVVKRQRNHNVSSDTNNTNLSSSKIQELVLQYNTIILPNYVQDIISNVDYNNGIIHLTDVTLLRNKVRFCYDNIVYKTWTL